MSNEPNTTTNNSSSSSDDDEPAAKTDTIHKYNIEQAIGEGPTPTLLSPSEPASAVITTATTETPESIQMTSPYQDMLKREYDHAVDEEIRKGIQEISERFVRLQSQERSPTDTSPHDNLGNTSDDYERIVTAYQSDSWQALAPTIEEFYAMLYDLRFTEMRDIEAIKQEYNQAPAAQQPEPQQ
jgi:hypothetical protein